MQMGRVCEWRVRCLVAIGTVLLGLLLWGCRGGAHCADGTVERGGQCVVKASACADGTVLENGECVPGAPPCGEGTRFDADSGACVPAADTCAEGTTFDQATGQCTPNRAVVCGDGTHPDTQGVCVVAGAGCATGTVLGDDGRCIPAAEACAAGTQLSASGQCVPSEDACGPKTRMDSHGRCVVDATACAAGTELDPNSGECVVVDAACGDGLALDANSMTCVPTDQVCAAGTRFDASSGLCLPDACQSGDVLVNGVCMAPAEELAQNADLTESENNDPALGGTAQALSLPAVGDPAFVFTGEIEAPRDVDADGYVDQDVDRFTLTATAGTWIDLGVQSLGATTPAFRVDGPNHFERFSGVGAPSSVARQLLLPYDGDYTVSILPQSRLGAEANGPVGGPDWGWVASLQQIAAPTAQPVDLGAANPRLAGRLARLSDNVFHVTGASAGTLVTLAPSVAPLDGQVVVQLWQDPTIFITEEPVAAQGPSFPAPAGDFIVVVDWKNTTGSRVDFDFRASTGGQTLHRDLAHNDSLSVTIQAQPFDVLELAQQNNLDLSFDLKVEGPEGKEVYTTPGFIEGRFEDVPVFKEGEYTVTVTNDHWSTPGVDLLVRRVPPIDLGTLQPNMPTRVGPLPVSHSLQTPRIFVKVDVPAMHVLEVAQDNQQDDDAQVSIYAADGYQESSDLYAAKGTADFEYHYRYFPRAESVLLTLSGAGTTGNVLELSDIAPNDIGAVSAGQTLTHAASSCEAGRAEWFSFSTAAAAHLQLDATSAAGGNLRAALLTSGGDELAREPWDNPTHTLLYQTLFARTFVGKVTCVDALSGLDLRIEASTPSLDDLGSLSSGSSTQSAPVDIADEDYQGYQVDLTAGDILEIAQDNDGSTYASVQVRDPSGGIIGQNDHLIARSSGGRGRYDYAYAATSGTYTFQVTAHSPVTNEVVHVRSIAPTPLGTLSETSPIASSPADALEAGKSAFYALTLATGGEVTSTVTTPNGEWLSQRLYAGTRQLVSRRSDQATLPAFQQGPVLLEVAARETITSHSVNLTLSNPLAAESEPNDTVASASAPGALPYTIYGHAEWKGQPGASDYFAVYLASDLAAGELLEIDCKLIELPPVFPAPTDFMTVHLFDAQGHEIAADLDEDVNDTFHIAAAGLTAGRYYVGVSNSREYGGKEYRLDVARQ